MLDQPPHMPLHEELAQIQDKLDLLSSFTDFLCDSSVIEDQDEGFALILEFLGFSYEQYEKEQQLFMEWMWPKKELITSKPI